MVFVVNCQKHLDQTSNALVISFLRLTKHCLILCPQWINTILKKLDRHTISCMTSHFKLTFDTEVLLGCVEQRCRINFNIRVL